MEAHLVIKLLEIAEMKSRILMSKLIAKTSKSILFVALRIDIFTIVSSNNQTTHSYVIRNIIEL